MDSRLCILPSEGTALCVYRSWFPDHAYLQAQDFRVSHRWACGRVTYAEQLLALHPESAWDHQGWCIQGEHLRAWNLLDDLSLSVLFLEEKKGTPFFSPQIPEGELTQTTQAK